MVDFYGQTAKFTDKDFPMDDALFWADFESERTGSVASMLPQITWVRMFDRYADNSLWGTNGITPIDVR